MNLEEKTFTRNPSKERGTFTTGALAIATPLLALTLLQPAETRAAGVHIHRDININKVWNGHGYNTNVNRSVSKHFNPSTTSPSRSVSRSVHVNVQPRPPVYIGVPFGIQINAPAPIILHPYPIYQSPIYINPFPIPHNHFVPPPQRFAPPPIQGFHGYPGHYGHRH